MMAPLAEVIRKVPASSQGSAVLGLGGSTITSAWTVQLPSNETRTTPSTVCVNFVGFPLASNATGVKVNVVPAWPLTTPTWAGTVVMASAAHPKASAKDLNRLSFVICFPFFFGASHPKLLFALAALSWPSLSTTGKLEESYRRPQCRIWRACRFAAKESGGCVPSYCGAPFRPYSREGC